MLLGCLTFSKIHAQDKKLEKFPQISVTNKDNKNVPINSLSSGDHPILILIFWAEDWCKPCKNALDSIAKYYKELHAVSELQVIEISTQGNPFSSQFMDEKESKYDFFWDKENTFIQVYKSRIAPIFFLLDKEFNILIEAIGADGSGINDYLLRWTNQKFIKAKNYIEVNNNQFEGQPINFPNRWPMYPNGPKGIEELILKNTQYPLTALNKGIQGLVKLSYVIQANGNVDNINIISSPDSLLTVEALRIIKLMDKWIPGMKNARPVSVMYRQTFKFTIKPDK